MHPTNHLRFQLRNQDFITKQDGETFEFTSL